MAPPLNQSIDWKWAYLISLILNALFGIENYHHEHISQLTFEDYINNCQYFPHYNSNQKIKKQSKKSPIFIKNGRYSKSFFSDGTFTDQDFSCFAEILSQNCNKINYCNISQECLMRMFNTTISTEHLIIRQVLYLATLRSLPCSYQISEYLFKKRKQTLEEFIAICCTNILEEFKYLYDLRRTESNIYEKMMEQVLVCGQFGFIEFGPVDLLQKILNWQHPKYGCYNENMQWVPSLHDYAGTITHGNAATNFIFDCSVHLTSLAGGVLTVFLLFLLDQNYLRHMQFVIDDLAFQKIPAEYMFRKYRSNDWVSLRPKRILPLYPPATPASHPRLLGRQSDTMLEIIIYLRFS
ncbi:unnamed protein product [Dracunculus medinensis]|uniref:UPF0764 protein C16orf89 homolog n=1 Tax=Dracunculus medinensis TaxID=318479 RepID=A0A0N4UHD7_DRAME|nr:unnamed protein product [Dracunculus medinensis]